jgi:hypothetical protein
VVGEAREVERGLQVIGRVHQHQHGAVASGHQHQAGDRLEEPPVGLTDLDVAVEAPGVAEPQPPLGAGAERVERVALEPALEPHGDTPAARVDHGSSSW